MTKFISERKENKVNHKLMNDLEWMLQTSWNLGLFCFSAGRHTEGMCLFDVISEVTIMCVSIKQLLMSICIAVSVL